MKRIIYMAAMAMAAAALAGCKDKFDKYDNSWLVDNDETMTLEASSTSIKLDADAIDETALTFTWTPAREMPEEYVVSYVTMLDLKSNQFNSSSVIRNVENEGVFEKSFTTEQLQNYIVEQWGQSVSEVSTVSFKIIAKWDGGDRYVMPEVRTMDVDIQPYKPLVFDADVVYVSGSAKTGTSQQVVSKTLENEYVYAIVTNLKPGELTIPVTYDGMTQYIAPSKDGAFHDGEAVPARMISAEDDGSVPENAGWEITGAGDYRIVIDMLNKTVTVYSPENEFNKPFVAEWCPNSTASLAPVTTEVTNLWLRGATAGWAAKGKDLKLMQSLADPQVLIYSGDAINNGDGRTSFAIISEISYDGNGDGQDETYNVNNAYQLAPPRVDADGDGVQDSGQDYTQELTLNTWMPMSGGTDIRGNYWKCNKGTNFIVFDLRNMRIRFETR